MADYPDTTKYPVHGVDCSFYQNDDGRIGRVNFDKMHLNGADFVICRAGQKNWPDPLFKEYWANSKGVMPRGSYWFYDSRENPKRQAELWVSILGNDLGELPLQADLEDEYKGQYHGWKHWYDFMERVKVLTGGKTEMVYTRYYYWKDEGPKPPNDTYFAQYDLWVANYETKTPLLPTTWKNWRLWQFTAAGDGRAYGVESKGIDLNYFNGTKAEFEAWAGMPPDGPTTPPEPPVEPIPGKVTLTVPKGTQVEIKELP